MVSAYRTALAEAGIDLNHIGYRISDAGGEAHYFKQTALASIRLLRGRHAFQDLWTPAEFVGNIGAAAVPLMAGMALTAATKRYARGNPALLETASDTGACASALFVARAA